MGRVLFSCMPSFAWSLVCSFIATMRISFTKPLRLPGRRSGSVSFADRSPVGGEPVDAGGPYMRGAVRRAGAGAAAAAATTRPGRAVVVKAPPRVAARPAAVAGAATKAMATVQACTDNR